MTLSGIVAKAAAAWISDAALSKGAGWTTYPDSRLERDAAENPCSDIEDRIENVKGSLKHLQEDDMNVEKRMCERSNKQDCGIPCSYTLNHQSSMNRGMEILFQKKIDGDDIYDRKNRNFSETSKQCKKCGSKNSVKAMFIVFGIGLGFGLLISPIFVKITISGILAKAAVALYNNASFSRIANETLLELDYSKMYK